MPLNPKALTVLSEIVDLGSFSRAAEALNVTQPTLSQSIKQLEAVVGAPVVRRSRHGISPTRIGEILAREGRSIRTAIAHADSGLKQWRAGVEGQLKIGVGPMIAQTIMPLFIEQVARERWNVGLRFHTEGARQIVSSVKSGSLDLALAPTGTQYVDDDMIKETMFEDDVGIYVGRQHPLAKQKSIGKRELADQAWISSGQMFGPRDTTTVVVERLGLKRPNNVLDFSGDVSMPLRLVARGQYLAIFPNFLMRHLPGKHRFVRLKVRTIRETRHIALWYRKDMESHPSVLSFRDQFLQFLAELEAD